MPEESISGPWVQLAAFCQTTMQETNGAFSIIRIIDRMQLVGQTPDLQPTPLQAVMVIILKSDFMRESAQITIRPNTPSGNALSPIEASALFEGEDRGVQIVLDMRGFPITEQGLYWFDILVNGVRLTRIPLRVLYQRLTLPGKTIVGPSQPQS